MNENTITATIHTEQVVSIPVEQIVEKLAGCAVLTSEQIAEKVREDLTESLDNDIHEGVEKYLQYHFEIGDHFDIYDYADDVRDMLGFDVQEYSDEIGEIAVEAVKDWQGNSSVEELQRRVSVLEEQLCTLCDALRHMSTVVETVGL